MQITSMCTGFKIEYLRGKTGMEIYENLHEACGKSSVLLNTVYRWLERFSDGKTDISDEPRCGRPVEVKSDGIAHPMNLRTQYHKTVSWNCKRSVALSQTHVENILPYTVKIDSARAVTTFSRNFRFFAIRKSLKMPEWNFSSIHGTCMSKIVYNNS